MKKISILLSIYSICGFHSSQAQMGCTDPRALNYNSSAKMNNGSCTYSLTTLPTSLKTTTPFVKENSGIAYIKGSIYTFGDSGNPASLYKIDTATGAILQTIHVQNIDNRDWEDMTDDQDYIYMGDFGNNDGDRKDLQIVKIAKAQFTNSTLPQINVSAEAIRFSYADQVSFESDANTNFDCESILSIGDSLYLFSKDRGDLKTRVYRLPKTPGSFTISPYAGYPVNGKITGADYNAETKEVALIGYMNGSKKSFIWLLSDFSGTDFFSGNKRRFELGNTAAPWQTEGIAFCKEKGSRRIFISCETKSDISAGIYVTDLHEYVSSPKRRK